MQLAFSVIAIVFGDFRRNFGKQDVLHLRIVAGRARAKVEKRMKAGICGWIEQEKQHIRPKHIQRNKRRMDIRTGKITGENCRGGEKPLRFRAEYPEAVVEAFYSDSTADAPMAALAKKAWLVKGDKLSPWPGKQDE